VSARGQRFLATDPAWMDLVRYGRANVGNALYHSVGERQQAMKSLALDFDQLYTELSHQILGATPEHPYGTQEGAHRNATWYLWWTSVAAPTFNAWRDFKAARSAENWTHGGSYIAYGEQFSTSWDEYEAWHKRLTILRDGARGMGIPLVTPEPVALPTTITQDAKDLAQGAASAVATVAQSTWTLAKVAAWSALGLGVVFGGTMIVNAARAPRGRAR
jgi:hypothetical protein